MRASFLYTPLALALLASFGAAAQRAPVVIFCKGECYTVDTKGVRAPAQKGTRVGDGLRFVTGQGAYAQLKLASAGVGISERADVRFDQRSVRDRDLVILTQGRIRMVDGEAFGKIATRVLELRTNDGTFALKGADLEVKTGGSQVTILKVNAGDASLRGTQGDIAISKDAALGVTGGKVVTDKTFSVADVALPPTKSTTPVSGSIGPGTT